MRDAEFKAWLEAGGAKTVSGRNTRVHAVRTIENNMAQMGAPHSDLEAAWRVDRFEQLRRKLKELKEDAAAGGTEFRVLMPQSDKPERRLSNWRSWLGQYGQFLGGERGDRDADRIRQYVLEHYIEDARERDLDTVDILVRDVNSALDLNQAWPNICQALTGAKFMEMADVDAPERIGADQSSATVLRFTLDGSADKAPANRAFVLFDAAGAGFKPVLNHNRATGKSAYRIKPPGASNRAEEAIEVDRLVDVARAMLLEGRPVRVQSLQGGVVNYVGYGKQKLVRYELDPAIAQEIGVPPNGEIADGMSLDRTGLEQLRLSFLAAHPDFRTFDQPSSYSGEEDVYKRPIIAEAERLVGEHATDGNAELGRALLDLAASKQHNLLGYYKTYQSLAEWRAATNGMFDAAAGALARSTAAPSVAAQSFVDVTWPTMEAGQTSKPYGDSRIFTSLLLALVRPADAIFVRTVPFNNAGALLLGQKLYGWNPLTAAEYDRSNELALSIFAIMRDEWMWRPRDLWDVQGFIWVTCQKLGFDAASSQPATDGTAAMTDTTNLILYGPPGTGKTYATAEYAVRLCGEEVPQDRDTLMARYRALSDAKRIEFVTFHQSMAYEDFVEGLRPTTDLDEVSEAQPDTDRKAAAGFRLKARDGLFKQISERARLAEQAGRTAHLDRTRAVFKIALGRRGDEEDRIREGLDRGLIHLGWGGDIDWSAEQFDDFQGIKRHWQETVDPAATGKDANIEMMYTFRAAMQPGDYVVLSDGRDLVQAIGRVTGEYVYDANAPYHPHRRPVEWLWQTAHPVARDTFYPRQFRRHSSYQLAADAIDWDALDGIVFGEQVADSISDLPFVLVIDEINRANMSKVFGELITLIEPDKRLGRANALKLRLPYSGEMFGVPANLHIIGTMNTADRSIALLDTALRRRFEFRELMPDASLLKPVDGIDLADLLATLNERIEYLFDREHQIGHAYFIRCATRADVDEVMRHKVIPLLAEYFYEDWAKVAAVLGDGDDGEGDREGRFINRRRLKAPKGLGGDEDAAPRYRWSVRDSFSYEGFAAA